LVVKYLGNEKLSNTGSLISRIRIGSGFSDFVDPIRIGNPDPDPYWESGFGSRGKKIKKFHGKNAHFSYLKKMFTTKKV
jgi:hypothetical protein